MDKSLEEIRFMLGNQLKNRRKELGLTQEEVANRMGVLQPHVARMETVGPRTVDNLLQWCLALDMKLILEPMKSPELVTKALDDPEVLDELIDTEEDIVEIPTVQEVLDAGKDDSLGIMMYEVSPSEPPITKKNRDMEFCKHNQVKGLCKKGCK